MIRAKNESRSINQMQMAPFAKILRHEDLPPELRLGDFAMNRSWLPATLALLFELSCAAKLGASDIDQPPKIDENVSPRL